MNTQSICKWALAAWLGLSSANAETDFPAPLNFYGFQSGQLVAQRRNESLLVVSATNRGLYVDTGKGSKRVSFESAVGLKRKSYIASNLIEIRNLEFDFQHLGKGAYERAALSQEQGVIFGYNAAIALLKQNPAIDNTEEIAELEGQRDEFREQMQEAIEDGPRGLAGLYNTLTLNIELQAEHAIEDAFCALVIRFITAASFNEPDQESRQTIRAQYLGDIPGSEPHQTTLKFDMPLGAYDTEDYQLYFYGADGQPLPTNKSPLLKKLTSEEYLDIMRP